MQPEQGHGLAGPPSPDPAPQRPAPPGASAAEAGPPAPDAAPPRAAEPGPPTPGAGAGAGPQRPAQAGAPLSEPKTFRLPGAIVAWWAWVIFAVVCLADIAFGGRNHTAAEIAATLVFVTGVVYACALRPRVVADSGGLTVQNPLRDHRIPWGSVTAVNVKESVQVHLVRDPGAKREKVIHSWALYTQRRGRLRAELLGRNDRNDRRRLPRSSYPPESGMSAEVQKIMKEPPAQIMATQLDDLAREARERGAAAGPQVVSWAWWAVAAIVVPAVVLVLVITVFR